MNKYIIGLVFFALCIIVACTDSSKPAAEEGDSCSKPVQDPNDVKPMALMMRSMANNCDSMRLKIMQGVVVDSMQYPLPPFWGAEPTDSSVLEQLFYNNANQIQQAYRTLMQNKDHQKENYTAVIQECIHCHSSYCSGPLRRIKKLPLDYKPE